jgi:hypothetical protein
MVLTASLLRKVGGKRVEDMTFDIADPKFDVAVAALDFRAWLYQFYDLSFNILTVHRWVVCKMFNRTCYERPSAKRCMYSCPIKEQREKRVMFKESELLLRTWLQAGFLRQKYHGPYSPYSKTPFSTHATYEEYVFDEDKIYNAANI